MHNHLSCSICNDTTSADPLHAASPLQVRSFAKEAASMNRYMMQQNRVVEQGLKSARASGFFQGLNGLVGTGSIVLVLWFGARQVRRF